MLKKTLPVASILFGLFLLTGCSSSGSLNYTKPASTPIELNKTVTLEVSGSAEPRITEQLRSDLFGRLVSERIFTAVRHREKPADYNLKINILSSSTVSPVARIMLGMLAGANKLKVDVKLFETATGKLHSNFVVTGESASHPMSSESGLENAVREVVSNIINGLK
jgi:uncharacterized lipoprotein YajG